MKASALSGWPISSSVRMTASPAPPWSEPLSAPIAADTAECASESVDATTRAVKVDAFSSCSA